MRVRTASWKLSAKPASVQKARRLTRNRLTRWGYEDQSEVAELLVSELVTDALADTYGKVRLSIFADEGLLRFEIEEVDDTGRGIELLELLSCCWGRDQTCRGPLVWFELPACKTS